MEKIKGIITRLFWLVFSVSMFLILGAALSKPLNNLIPGDMIWYTLVWIVFFGVMWRVCCLLERKAPCMPKLLKYGLPVYLVLFGVALYTVSCLLRCGLFSDYESIYTAALHFARGEEVANWEYFARWNNNVGSMLGLSLLFFLGGWLPAGVDVYYFVLLLNVVQVMLVVYCLYDLAGKLFKTHPVAAPLMTLGICTVWIPVWANTSIFYSDQLSFGAGVFGVTLLLKSWECQRAKSIERTGGMKKAGAESGKRNPWLVYAIGAGVCFGCGAVLKVTSATVLIALVIGCFLYRIVWKHKKELFVAVVSCVVVLALFSAYCRTLPYQEDAERLKVPTGYWFALGLKGNGTYAESEEFAIRCLAAEDVEQRQLMIREQIGQEIHNLWNPEHIIGKARQNFGCGDLGAAGYLLFPYHENVLWHWFSMDGDYYWKYACLSTAFFFSVLFYLGTGGLLQFVRKGKAAGKSKAGGQDEAGRQNEADRQKEEADEREEAGFFIAALAFWGLCLFLMLWEAQDKQMYNHSGWLIISLLCSLNLTGGRPT